MSRLIFLFLHHPFYIHLHPVQLTLSSRRHSSTTPLPCMTPPTMLTASPALRHAIARAGRLTPTTTTVARQATGSQPAQPQANNQQQQQQQQRRHVSASTRKTAAAPAPAAGRTVPSPAFNRDDATANVHPLKPFRRPDMDHSFVGMTGGQIFHDMMLRHGVKTICKYSLSPFPRLSSCCDGEGGRRVMRLLGLGREGLGSRKSSYLYLN